MQLCVHLVDYVLIFSGGTINRSNFQLLGITALFVASKYNEVQTMEADRYVQMCDGLYGLQQMLDMESTILNLT